MTQQVLYILEYASSNTFSFLRSYISMISIHISNNSIFRTIETIATVKILLSIILLLPLNYQDSTIAKATIVMYR